MAENGNSEGVREGSVRSHKVREAICSIASGMYEHPENDDQIMEAILRGLRRDMEVWDG